jgi:hypothetical protein
VEPLGLTNSVSAQQSVKVFHKTVKVGDLDIFYREAGPKDAPTILLLAASIPGRTPTPPRSAPYKPSGLTSSDTSKAHHLCVANTNLARRRCIMAMKKTTKTDKSKKATKAEAAPPAEPNDAATAVQRS